MSPQGRPGPGRRTGRGGSDRRRRAPSLTEPPSPYDVEVLERYVSDRGKIRPRAQTKLSERDQRAVARAIKIARELALMPYRRDAPPDRRRARGGQDDGASG